MERIARAVLNIRQLKRDFENPEVFLQNLENVLNDEFQGVQMFNSDVFVDGKLYVLGDFELFDNRYANIPDPTGGTVIDIESRNAIVEILNLLKHFGLMDA